VPLTLILPIFIDITFELTHNTPVHDGVEHTDVTGDPPLHRQPVTSVLVPKFVDATKSHIAASETDTVGDKVGIIVGLTVGIPFIITGNLHTFRKIINITIFLNHLFLLSFSVNSFNKDSSIIITRKMVITI
jgi:hypothetical protein